MSLLRCLLLLLLWFLHSILFIFASSSGRPVRNTQSCSGFLTCETNHSTLKIKASTLTFTISLISVRSRLERKKASRYSWFFTSWRTRACTIGRGAIVSIFPRGACTMSRTSLDNAATMVEPLTVGQRAPYASGRTAVGPLSLSMSAEMRSSHEERGYRCRGCRLVECRTEHAFLTCTLNNQQAKRCVLRCSNWRAPVESWSSLAALSGTRKKWNHSMNCGMLW